MGGGDKATERKDSEVRDLASALTVARGELEDIRNREAACCPEDVAFDEYIEALVQKNTDLTARLASACMSLLAMELARDKRLARARSAVAFFASVIKSGEPWTPSCQEALDEALAVQP